MAGEHARGRRRLVLAAAGLALAIGTGVVLGGSALAAAGALIPKGCTDDNDSGTDPNQGPDNCKQKTNGLDGVKSVVISSDGRSLYAASELDDAVVHFARNPDTGKLKAKDCIDDNDTGIDPFQGPDNCADSTDGLAEAGGLVLSPDDKWLYAVGQADDAIVRFKVKASGALVPKGCVEDNDNGTDPTQGEDACTQSTNGLNQVVALAISPNGRSLYAVSENDDAVVRFDRDKETGALTPMGCIDDNDTGIDPTQGEDACAASTGGLLKTISVVVSRDGDSVYATSEDSAVVRFDRASDGSLTPMGCIEDAGIVGGDCLVNGPGLAGADSATLSRDDKTLYVTSESDSSITWLKRNTDSGALTVKDCVEDAEEGLGECSDDTVGLGEPALIAITRDGASVYVSTEGDAAIVRFKRKANGSLVPKGCVEDNDLAPAGGCAQKTNGLAGVEGLALSPDDSWLYATSNADDAVSRFKRSG